jgi:hypothetical protein
MNKKQWFKLLKETQPKLVDIVQRFAPDKVKEFETQLTDGNMRECVRILNVAWWNAPDQPGIHQIPGWGVLCALCSEATLEPEETEEL